MTRKAPEETRRALVQAAIRRIQEHGAASLSLDAVAADAHVSKGGLLHHFPTKIALLEGVAAQLVRDFEGRIEAALAGEEPQRAGSWLRAYIRATFDAGPGEPQVLAQVCSVYPEIREFSSGLYAASDLARPRDDGLPPARALLIRAACDGWWFAEYFGASLVTSTEREDLRDELLRIAQ